MRCTIANTATTLSNHFFGCWITPCRTPLRLVNHTETNNILDEQAARQQVTRSVIFLSLHLIFMVFFLKVRCLALHWPIDTSPSIFMGGRQGMGGLTCLHLRPLHQVSRNLFLSLWWSCWKVWGNLSMGCKSMGRARAVSFSVPRSHCREIIYSPF